MDRKLCSAGTVVALLSLFISGCATNVVVRSRSLVESGSPQQAIDLLNVELLTHPDNEEAWQELGFAYYKAGDYAHAHSALGSAPQDDPRTLLIRGLVFEGERDYESAIASYLSALDWRPAHKTRSLLQRRLNLLVREQLKPLVSHLVAEEQSIRIDTIPENTVAVVRFDGSRLQPELAPLAKGLASMTVNDLDQVRALRLVERLKIDLLLKELDLVTSGYVDVAAAPRVGRLLGSRRLVTGFLLNAGGEITINGDIVQVADSSDQILDVKSAKLEQFFKLQKEFVFVVLDSLDVTVTPEERAAISRVPTESFEAFMAYSRGLDYQDRGMLDQARREYKNAAAADPGFGEAGAALENVEVEIETAGLPDVSASELAAGALGDPGGELGQESGLSGTIIELSELPETSDNQATSTNSEGPNEVPPVASQGTIVIRGQFDEP